MMLNFLIGRESRMVLVVCLLSGLAGCGGSGAPATPAAPGQGANQSSPATAPAAAQTTLTAGRADSPAFATPAEAVQAWHAAYQQDGIEGHLRTTFCQTEDAESRKDYEAILNERFSTIAAAKELEVLETIERAPFAAVVVRGDGQVAAICLYQDAEGWHVSRRLVDLLVLAFDWSSPSTTELMKASFEMGAIATARAGQWARGNGSSTAPTAAAGGKIDSPAFATPEEAVNEWLRAYREDGEAGHRRLTFDETNVPEARWQATLAERFHEAVQADALEIVEIMQRPPLAAAITRSGDQLAQICLYRDADGWHVSRTLVDWETVAPVGDYSKDRDAQKRALDFSVDIGLKGLEHQSKQ